MNNIFQDDPTLIYEVNQGLERETLRVDHKGFASQKKHPAALGSKLTHPSITTDYSENLMEFITPVFKHTNDLLKNLKEVQAYSLHHMDGDQFWPSSMPAILEGDDKVPLAYYGESNVGKLKTLYRKGLGLRYGRSMQSIAGVHYNFSLSDNFWNYLKKIEKNDQEFKEYKNEKYFHLIRNFQRYRWLLIYLFGSSPVVDKSFLHGKDHKLSPIGNDSYARENGISLRMGGLGYTSKAQEEIGICFNALETYLKTLEKARLTSYPAYEKIGLKKGEEFLQLNTNILQIDNEFYSTIRPKAVAKSRESALLALHRRGIEYIEVRLLDVNPFTPLGIDKESVNFLHLFLVWCLVSDSPKLSDMDCDEAQANFDKVVTSGRADKVELFKASESIDVVEWAKEILDSINNFSKEIQNLDNHYHIALDMQYRKLEHKDALLSSKVLNSLGAKSFVQFNQELINQHIPFFDLDAQVKDKLDIIGAYSIDEEKRVHSQDKLSFDQFLAQYFEDIKIEF